MVNDFRPNLFLFRDSVFEQVDLLFRLYILALAPFFSFQHVDEIVKVTREFDTANWSVKSELLCFVINL